MKLELENKIWKDFPWMEARNVWTDKKLKFPTPCSCDSGWFELIYNLCKEIDEHYKSKKADIRKLRILQIKEKYGGLRFYVGSFIEGTDEIIYKYEEMSYEICEVCGDKGKLMNRGCWYKTLCNKCSIDLNYADIQDKSEII